MTQKMGLREYIDTLRAEGYTVQGSKGLYCRFRGLVSGR